MGKYRLTPIGVTCEIMMFKEKIKQIDIAKKLGLAPSVVSKVVRGQFNTCPNFMVRACKEFPEYFPEDKVDDMVHRSKRWYKVYQHKIPYEEKQAILKKLREYC